MIIKLDTIIDEQRSLQDGISRLGERVDQLESVFQQNKDYDQEFVKVRFK